MKQKGSFELTILYNRQEVGNYFFDITRLENNKIEVKYNDRNNKERTVFTSFGTPFTIGKDILSFTYFPKKNEQNIKAFQVKVDSIPELAYTENGRK